MKRISLIVGHLKGAPGASNYLNESEYSFSSRILETVRAKLDDYVCHVKVFYRDGSSIAGVGSAVTMWGADLSIESHFNSFSSPVTGRANTEALALEHDKKSVAFAKLFGTYMQDVFGYGLRHDRGCKEVHYRDRGAGNLSSIKLDIPKILVEPIFANKKTPESVNFFKRENDYINLLTSLIVDALELKLNSQPHVPVNPEQSLKFLMLEEAMAISEQHAKDWLDYHRKWAGE